MGTIIGFADRSEVAKEAAEWLIRLDGDQPPTQEELRTLGEWLCRNPVHREELESMSELWGRMNMLTELAVPLGHESRPDEASRHEHVAASRRSVWRAGMLVAASAAVLAVVVVLIARGVVNPFSPTNSFYATAVGQQITTKLADGSEVMLNTNSQIKVEYSDEYRRVYLLQGEALFTVAKNSKRPFRVYAGNGLIEAVGTAFSVYLKGAEVDIAVTEGRVSLAAISQPPSPAAIQPSSRRSAPEESAMQPLGLVSAGQVATIRIPSTAGGVRGASMVEQIGPIPPVELAQRLAWREGVLMFSGETLEHVVKELARYTTVSIEIPDEAIRTMRVGGRFPVGETETMLAALETNFNVRVIRVSHNRVVLAPAHE